MKHRCQHKFLLCSEWFGHSDHTTLTKTWHMIWRIFPSLKIHLVICTIEKRNIFIYGFFLCERKGCSKFLHNSWEWFYFFWWNLFLCVHTFVFAWRNWKLVLIHISDSQVRLKANMGRTVGAKTISFHFIVNALTVAFVVQLYLQNKWGQTENGKSPSHATQSLRTVRMCC